MTIAEKILIFRARNNLSQRQFAELCGTDQPYISAIENGRRPGKIMEAKINFILKGETTNGLGGKENC